MIFFGMVCVWHDVYLWAGKCTNLICLLLGHDGNHATPTWLVWGGLGDDSLSVRPPVLSLPSSRNGLPLTPMLFLSPLSFHYYLFTLIFLPHESVMEFETAVLNCIYITFKPHKKIDWNIWALPGNKSPLFTGVEDTLMHWTSIPLYIYTPWP